jgi:PEP-CTERM motif-containing protein
MPGFRPNWGWSLSVLVAFSLMAGPASAVSGSIHFDGLGGFGVAQGTALASGIPILPDDALLQADGLGTIRDLDESTIVSGPPATATSNWNVQNNTGHDLMGTLYLVFAKPLDNTIVVNGQNQVVSYAPTDVGLTLQNGLGGFDWVILQVPDGANLYYYPAVSLGSLGAGQTTASPFQVNYILEDPQIFLEPTGFELGIPKWQLLATFVPIPEPSTLPLVVVGIGLLAIGRRRRS